MSAQTDVTLHANVPATRKRSIRSLGLRYIDQSGNVQANPDNFPRISENAKNHAQNRFSLEEGLKKNETAVYN